VKSGDTEHTEWRSCCSISSALDVLGDRWSLLIIRDLFVHGTRTFSQFLDSPEHISTNILAARLKLLTQFNLIERIDPNASARNNAFTLTASGAALRPIIESLADWSHTHLKQFHDGITSIR
jgi:DNA-binding HxlR family transcriptional regulator